VRLFVSGVRGLVKAGERKWRETSTGLQRKAAFGGEFSQPYGYLFVGCKPRGIWVATGVCCLAFRRQCGHGNNQCSGEQGCS
jgi:hypothetical protein